jgi:hypothetical protein
MPLVALRLSSLTVDCHDCLEAFKRETPDAGQLLEAIGNRCVVLHSVEIGKVGPGNVATNLLFTSCDIVGTWSILLLFLLLLLLIIILGLILRTVWNVN